MCAQHGNRETIDRNTVIGGVEGDGEAATGRGALDIIVEAERFGILEDEVGRCEGGPHGQEGEKSRELHYE